MNQFLAARYAERVDRLALGLEPVEALGDERPRAEAERAVTPARWPPERLPRAPRAVHPVHVVIEPVPPPLAWYQRLADRGGDVHEEWESLPRRASCRHVLLYAPGLGDHVTLRLFDAARRYVPRRVRVPLAVLAPADPAPVDALPVQARSRRPALFPGAAYPLPGGTTAIRGRVLRGGAPARWARVEARRQPADPDPVAVAHGDDRGEYLLVLGPGAAPAGPLPASLTLHLTAVLPATAPAAAAAIRAADPLWDLPLEPLPAAGLPDPVSPGRQRPPGYTLTLTLPQPVTVPVGRIRTHVPDFLFP